jgi:hypothetical protein
MEQGSEEWIMARLGLVTASCFSDVMAKGEGTVRKKYMRRLVSERLTGSPTEAAYSSPHLERGVVQEPYARLAYEAATGNVVEEVGFIKHPSLLAGASPDGIIDHDGGPEIKCVIPSVQIETIERGKYPSSHKAQIMGNLWITGRKWWDFVSYSPALPQQSLRLYIFRVERDEEYIQNLEAEVVRFLDEAEEMYQRLIRRAA